MLNVYLVGGAIGFIPARIGYAIVNSQAGNSGVLPGIYIQTAAILHPIAAIPMLDIYLVGGWVFIPAYIRRAIVNSQFGRGGILPGIEIQARAAILEPTTAIPLLDVYLTG